MKVAGGYYLTIPAAVYTDPDLTDSSRLFFGVVASLTNERGYCYASDAYLADRSSKSERTVRRMIAALEDAGHVRVENEPKTDGSGGSIRRIYLTPIQSAKSGPKASPEGYRTKMTGTGGVPDKNDRYVPDKNDRSYITSNQEKNIIPSTRSSSTTAEGSDSAATAEEGISEDVLAQSPPELEPWSGVRFWSDRDEEDHGEVVLEFLTKYSLPDPTNFAFAYKRAFGSRPSPLVKTEVLKKCLAGGHDEAERRARWDKLIAAIAVAGNAGLSGSPKAISSVLQSWRDNPPKVAVAAELETLPPPPRAYYHPRVVHDLCGLPSFDADPAVHFEKLRTNAGPVMALRPEYADRIGPLLVSHGEPVITSDDWKTEEVPA